MYPDGASVAQYSNAMAMTTVVGEFNVQTTETKNGVSGRLIGLKY